MEKQDLRLVLVFEFVENDLKKCSTQDSKSQDKSGWVPKIKQASSLMFSFHLFDSMCFLLKELMKIWWNTGAVLLFGCVAALESDSKLFGFHICNDGDRNKHATSVKGSSYRLVYSQVTTVPGTTGAVGKQLRLKRNTEEKLKNLL